MYLHVNSSYFYRNLVPTGGNIIVKLFSLFSNDKPQGQKQSLVCRVSYFCFVREDSRVDDDHRMITGSVPKQENKPMWG